MLIILHVDKYSIYNIVYTVTAIFESNYVVEAASCSLIFSELQHKNGLMEYFSGSAFGYCIYGLSALLCLLVVLGVCFDRGFFSEESERLAK